MKIQNSMKYFQKSIIVILFLVVLIPAYAEIRLLTIFSSKMVLQCNSDVAIWGKDKEKAEVNITTSWNNLTHKTKSDKQGDVISVHPVTESELIAFRKCLTSDK